MTRIIAKTTPGTAPAPARATTGPVKSTPATPAELRHQLAQAIALQEKLRVAVAAGQYGPARAIQTELRAAVAAIAKGSQGPERAGLVASVVAATKAVERQLAAATQPKPAPAPAPAAPPANGGPLGFLGRAAQQTGNGLEKVGKVLFFPLTALGKVLDPVRSAVGGVLGGAKQAIDQSAVGQAPVIGQAVRFTTGLASSLVGMVDGAVQAVTHPIDLIKGVGHIAGTVLSLAPGPRQAWDYAVHGTDPVTSYKAALGEGKALATALVQPAIDDIKAGNYAGAAGRLVGDVGSLLITGGAAGSLKVAGVSVLAKGGKLGKLGSAARAGVRMIGAVDELSAKIITAGFKTNLAPVARVLGEVGPLRKVAPLADDGARAMASPAAVAKKAKAAYTFSDDLLAGEVRHAGAPDVARSIADQGQVVGKLNGMPVWEHLFDQVSGGLIDHEAKMLGAFKGLKVDGKLVTDMKQAAKAWDALPQNAPERVAIAKQLAGAMQDGFADGLKFEPAPIRFTKLDDHLAGQQNGRAVLLDPSLLNENLRYLVDVMAEEQTHAYQRFLTENRDVIKMDPKMAAEVARYVDDFQVERYTNPPAPGLARLAEGAEGLNKTVKDLADHADENLALMLRREVAPTLKAATPERALMDAWWAKAGPESERLSFMKFALGDLNKIGPQGHGLNTWLGDYAGRLPEGITHLDGVGRTLTDAKDALGKAIKESQGTLAKANTDLAGEFRAWTDSYKKQALEFTAQNVASDVSKWMFGE